jgi:hypothetical protein
MSAAHHIYRSGVLPAAENSTLQSDSKRPAGGDTYSSVSTFARVRACALRRQAFVPTAVSVVDRHTLSEKTTRYVSLRDFAERMGLPLGHLSNLTEQGVLSYCLAEGEIFVNFEKGVRELEELEFGPTPKLESPREKACPKSL